ncbi:MAG: hypothetical protein EBX40_04845 [Gammaproteobacteria bacterium]|nr:hypothetical protein [Gammaproteobacteria bacterium]
MDRISSELKKNYTVKIGVLSNEKREDGFGAAELAAVHEFGTDKIPERSFLRSTFKSRQDDFEQVMSQNKASIIKGIVENGLEPFLAKVGAEWVGYVQETFKAQGPGWMPLSPRTLAARQARAGQGKPFSSTILVDTGAMLRSITFEVKKE